VVGGSGKWERKTGSGWLKNENRSSFCVAGARRVTLFRVKSGKTWRGYTPASIIASRTCAWLLDLGMNGPCYGLGLA